MIKNLQEILNNHRLWLEDNEKGERADLTGKDLSHENLHSINLSHANLLSMNLSRANLFGANLSNANLFDSNLSYANLSYTNLYNANLANTNLTGTNLSRANLYSSNLFGSNLSRSNLIDANLSRSNLLGTNLIGANLTGEIWEEYIKNVVPTLLQAGGKSLEEILATGCWDCHSWQNCPMSVAFNIKKASEAPILLKPRVKQFVALFDLKIIPKPILKQYEQC